MTQETTGFQVGADITPFEQSMARMVSVSKESQDSVSSEFEKINSKTGEMQNVFLQVGNQIKQVFIDAGVAVREQMAESVSSEFESIKEDAKITAIAVSAAFAVVGLGAIYTATKVIASSFSFIKGLFTGESYKNDDVNKLKEAINQNEELRNSFAVTREYASAMALAFDAVGTSASGYTQTTKTLFSAVKDNNDSLKLLGVDTKRTGDDIADFERINKSAAEALEKYKVGADRAAAATAAGLPTYEALKEAQKTTSAEFASAREEAATYGLTISNEVVAAAKEYDKAILQFNHNSNLTWNGMSRAIADGVMPILTDLAVFFKDGFPAIANSTRGVVASLVSLYHGFAMSIYTVAESVLGAIKAMGQALGGVGNAVSAAMRGDFSGAWEAIKQGGKNAMGELGDSFDNIAARGASATAKMRLAWLGGQEGESPSTPKSGGKKWTPPKDASKSEGQKSEPKEPSYMQTYEAALDQRKLAFEKENELLEFSKQRELEYWREILATYEVGSKDRTAISVKMGKLELDILRQGAKDKAAITQLRAEDYKAETLSLIAELDARAAFEHNLGITSQQDYLTRQQTLNALRLQAELDFIAQKVEVARLDPEANVVTLEQLEIQKLEIKRKYKALESDLARQQSLESTEQYRSMFGSIQSGWASAIGGMMSGAQTISQGLKSMFKTVVDSIIGMLAQMVAKWLVQQLLMLAFGKAMGASTVATKSAEAGAGGVASMAAAPFPLNLSAPLFGAAMAATAASFGAVASASGGFDIPRGLDPLTQLHAEEMVLPASIANPLRESIDGGGMSAAAAPVSFTVNALDARSVRDFFNQHGGSIVEALHGQRRNFKF